MEYIQTCQTESDINFFSLNLEYSTNKTDTVVHIKLLNSYRQILARPQLD